MSQQYELLAEAADRRGGRLERRVNFLLDEFGNFTPISDMTNKLTVAAGRGMRYALYVQGFDQLKEKYSDNIANTIKGNCQIWAYLQSDDIQLSALGQQRAVHHTVQLPERQPDGAQAAQYG